MRSGHAVALALGLLSGPLLAQQAVPHGWVRTTRHTLARQGLEVTETRWVGDDGRAHRRSTLADGTEVDVDALRRREHELDIAARGRLAPTLRDRLAAMDEDETVQVAFWLTEPQDGVDLGRSLRALVAHVPRAQRAEATRAARRQTQDLAVQRYAARNAAFAETVRGAGGTVDLEPRTTPVVIATVTPARARALALDPRVDEAYLSMPTWEEEGEHAQGTLRTPTVWAQGLLADGSVNVLVNDTTQVQGSNPYLPPIINLNTFSEGSHSTGVAGNIANSHPAHKAAAYTQPQLYSAGGTGDVNAPIIWDDAIANGIDIGNCSWWNFLKGQIEFLDRYFDFIIRNYSVMMFKSNGNQGTTSTPYGTSPGQGYNMTCSGAYSDQDNLVWSDDAMAASSSYWDPAEGHEKPEVASPGTCVTTAGTGGSGLQTCFGGTSSASPLTAGVATLMLTADNTLLAEMTSLKALLMATAWHNVDGPVLLSEKDGAGGVHAAAAYAAVRDQQWQYQEVVEGDFVGDVLDIEVDLAAGEHVRAIALWFGNPDEAYATEVLDMDLDMVVKDPEDNVLAIGLDAFNPFEIVGFVSTVPGTYTFRLTKFRFDGDSEQLSFAWSTRRDTNTARVTLADGSAPFAAGSTPTLQFEEPYEGAGKTYIAWASFTTEPGGSLGDGYPMPIGFDALSGYTLGLPGFVGALDPFTGLATADLPIPNGPNVSGLQIHLAMGVAGPGGGPLDIHTMSDSTPFTIE